MAPWGSSHVASSHFSNADLLAIHGLSSVSARRYSNGSGLDTGWRRPHGLSPQDTQARCQQCGGRSKLGAKIIVRLSPNTYEAPGCQGQKTPLTKKTFRR